MFKVQVALCLLSSLLIEGGVISSPTYVHTPSVVAVRQVEEFDAYPQYNYGYSVNDPLSGDYKMQEESRDGEVVRGRYALVQPDGTLQIVTYYADSTGFHAVVERQGGLAAPAPVQPVVVQPVRPIHVQVPFRPLPPPAPVQVIHPQPAPVPVEIPAPVQEIVQPQPQPIEFPQQPQPIHPPTPVEIPQQPQPQPQPIETPQPFPVPQPQPQPIQPQFPQQQPQRPQEPQENFDDAEIIEARSNLRADSGFGSGSSFTYRSSRGGQHDFNFSY